MANEREAMTLEQVACEMRDELDRSRHVIEVSIEAFRGWTEVVNRTSRHLSRAAEPVEMSPEFTDSARAAIAWVLWHHQGGSSAVGQPLRFALGMGAHEQLSTARIAEAKRWAEWSRAKSADFHADPPEPARDACTWLEDWEGNWNTDCGHMFVLNEGTPDDNGMKVCFYCGHKLEQKRHSNAAMAQESGDE